MRFEKPARYKPAALRQLKALKRSHKLRTKTLSALESLINGEALEYSNTNKPLKGDYVGFDGCWSKQTDQKNRIVYTVEDETLIVISVSGHYDDCLLYTSPSPRDRQKSRMPSSA